MNNLELRKTVAELVQWEWFNYLEESSQIFAVEPNSRRIRFQYHSDINNVSDISWNDAMAAAIQYGLFENPLGVKFWQTGIFVYYDEYLGAPPSTGEIEIGPFEKTPEGLLLAILETEKIRYKYSVPDKIMIGSDGRCTCDCSQTCPLGRIGMEYRCTAEELLEAGFKIGVSL